MPETPDPALLDQLRSALDSSYEIERELTGGMSRVFVATDKALGRKVVLKVLPPELTAGVNRDRFRREIQFAARLQHPHIVPLLTAGQVGEILYYTMPFVEGETLRSRLEREGRLGAGTVLSILQDVVDALAYAHANGLVHRDIKPENILLQRHHALVTDFGVAKALTEALPGIGATTAGIAVGTPAYMAPEQLAADPAADHRVDLYAIGLMAYELLSGSSPFKGNSPQQTLARQLTERPTPPHITRADVPPALSTLIMRCLEKDPSARFASADELLQAIAEVRITAEFRAITPTERLPAAVPPRQKLNPVVVVAILVSLGTVALATLTRKGKTPAPAAAVVAGDSTARGDTGKTTSIAVTPAPPPAAPQLTRADSEAIAASVSKRMTEKRSPAIGLSQHQLDSIRDELQKALSDSVRAIVQSQQKQQQSGPEGLTVPLVQSMRDFSRLGNLGIDTRLYGLNRSFRVVVPDVVDGSEDKSLGIYAKALTDSLIAYVRRRPVLQLVSGPPARGLARRFDDPNLTPRQRSADVLVQGFVRPAGDSIEAGFRLQNAEDATVAKTFKHVTIKADPGALAGVVTPMVVAWIDHREESTRSSRIVMPFNSHEVDSLMKLGQRFRDMPRPDRPPARPDSVKP